MNFLYILLAIFIFGLLIFIHELGHYLVARLCGVKILEFSIGMGPKLISWRSKKTGTAYSLRLLPLGGYVNMLGENGMELVQGDSTGENEEEAPDGDKKDDFFVMHSNPLDEDSRIKQPEPIPLTEEELKQAYCNQSVWKRMLISLAGPVMNVLLGFVLMFVMVASSGPDYIGWTEVQDFHIRYDAETPILGEGSADNIPSIQTGDYIRGLVFGAYSEETLKKEDIIEINSFAELKQYVSEKNGEKITVVVERAIDEAPGVGLFVVPYVTLTPEMLDASFTPSLSEKTGLQVGDVITKVNNTSVHTAHELIYEISNQGIRPMKFTVLRDGEKVVLEKIQVPNMEENKVVFGDMDFRINAVSPEEFHVGTILQHTWFRSCSTVKMVFDSITGLFTGRYGVEAVSGPVGITKTISDAAQMGIMNVIYLVVVISINLGVMNLLPIPGLDGGHLLIHVIEAIRRKPIKKEIEGMINFIGLILLLALAVIISIKDIISL